jgi:hypothetical protein
MRFARAGRPARAARSTTGIPPPVAQRRWWAVCATVAVAGTIAAALLPSPWSIVCGALAALGAVGAFGFFVAISILEDRDRDG